jgi:hypothetical protein
MAVIQGQNLVVVVSHQATGQIMKLTRALLFVPARRTRKTQYWFERAKLVVAAARDRAVEKTAQQRAEPSMKAPLYRATEAPLGWDVEREVPEKVVTPPSWRGA